MASRERRRYVRIRSDAGESPGSVGDTTPQVSGYQAPSRRRRFAARSIDLILVFFGALFLYWGAAILYYIFEGCTGAGFQSSCRDTAIGGYVAIVVFTVAFVFPLIYESLFRRTLGKTLLDLDIVDRNQQLAVRKTRLKRSFAAWVPILAFFAGTALTSGGISSLIGTVWFLYATALLVTVLARMPTAHDWLAGTRVVYLPKKLLPAQATVENRES